MFHPRYYYCTHCRQNFASSDGVVVLPSRGVTCPHCGSKKTRERGLFNTLAQWLGF